MVSMQPTRRISSDGKLMAEESRVSLQLLPLRVNLDQHALTFVKSFFASDIPSSAGDDFTYAHTYLAPWVLVTLFQVTLTS